MLNACWTPYGLKRFFLAIYSSALIAVPVATERVFFSNTLCPKRCQDHIGSCASHTWEDQAIALFFRAHTGPGNVVRDSAADQLAQAGAAGAVAAGACHRDAGLLCRQQQRHRFRRSEIFPAWQQPHAVGGSLQRAGRRTFSAGCMRGCAGCVSGHGQWGLSELGDNSGPFDYSRP